MDSTKIPRMLERPLKGGEVTEAEERAHRIAHGTVLSVSDVRALASQDVPALVNEIRRLWEVLRTVDAFFLSDAEAARSFFQVLQNGEAPGTGSWDAAA
jgi:hypothetical protein